MPALLDTGASRTVLSPKAIHEVGLRKINEANLGTVGSIERVGVYVAAIQFPALKFATIEVIEVPACELPELAIECLIGRDILARWKFNYDGPKSSWRIEEEDVALWVEPPLEIDI